jgi:NinB protein
MRKFLITGPIAREAIRRCLEQAEEGSMVVFRDSDRTLEQNAKFHAICHDVSRAATFAGAKRTAEQWKLLFVSGHTAATGGGQDLVAGLEGEWCNLREATSRMSKSRLSSLIEYCLAWCAANGVDVTNEKI